jgi:hypothetical protein
MIKMMTFILEITSQKWLHNMQIKLFLGIVVVVVQLKEKNKFRTKIKYRTCAQFVVNMLLKIAANVNLLNIALLFVSEKIGLFTNYCVPNFKILTKTMTNSMSMS